MAHPHQKERSIWPQQANTIIFLNCKPRWIRCHRRNFLNHISQQGYSIYTCWLYRRAVTLFCAERFSRNLRKADLRNIRIKSLIEEVLQHLPKSIRSHARFSLGRFIEHLAQAGAIKLRQPPPKILTDRERLEDEYISYLRHQRGMSQSTINSCRNSVGSFPFLPIRGSARGPECHNARSHH